MTPREELVQRLEAERYGPVVHAPVSIPHIPLVAYHPELLDEVLAEEEVVAVQAWQERQARKATRDRERRAEKKRRRAMTEAEIEHAV